MKQLRNANDVLADMLGSMRGEVARCEIGVILTEVMGEKDDLDPELKAKLGDLGDMRQRKKAFQEAAEVLEQLLLDRKVEGVLGGYNHGKGETIR